MEIPQFLKDQGIQQIVGIDFETYYSTSYTMEKMSTTDYVRSPEFYAQGIGIRSNRDTETTWYKPCDIAAALHDIDWTNTAVMAHNTAFDGLILHSIFKQEPMFFIDTYSMARGMLPAHISASLDSVAQRLGVGRKIEGVLASVKNKKWLTGVEEYLLGEYCKQDVNLMWEIFEIMLPNFPAKELKLIDVTIRMYAAPIIQGDIVLAETEYTNERARKHNIFQKVAPLIGVTTDEEVKELLGSNPKFVDTLAGLGVKCPTKWSAKQKKHVPALAKTDLDFQALQVSDDENIRDICEARLAVKSNIGERRAERFIRYAKGGALPIMLNMYGAHTHRWSGGDKFNPQNFPRQSVLKEAMRAPKGFKVMVIDSAQIEARCLAFIAGQTDLLEEFRDELIDPYKNMAGTIYIKNPDGISKEERFVGKVAVLGLGFGMGGAKFQNTLATGAMGLKVRISLQEAERTKSVYRAKNSNIVKLWREFENILARMSNGLTTEAYGMVFEPDGVLMPNGLYVHYPELRGEYNTFSGTYGNFTYKARYGRTNIYGGKFVENIIQSYARSVVAEQILIIAERYRVVLAVHDECVFLVPINEVAEAEKWSMEVFKTPPTWATGLPLDGEIDTADYYSK